jgi:CheY-like chemotaxis protein
MTDDDLISLNMMIVSDVAADRELFRRALALASVPIQVVELDASDDGVAACATLANEPVDAVLFDSGMSKAGRQRLIEAAHAAKEHPLAILIGAAALKTREVLTDGLPVNGVLAKPIDAQELRSLIENCVRARLPNRALIVDDSSTVRSVIRKVLQASCFRLSSEEAGEGATAIEMAKQRPYDIVFLDCHMPGLDGFATLAELRRALPDTKVVMITGTHDMRIEDRARGEGANDFLYKPFFAKDIDAVLSRLFGLMRARWN